MYSGVVCGMSSSHWHVIASNAGRTHPVQQAAKSQNHQEPTVEEGGASSSVDDVVIVLLSKGGEDQEDFLQACEYRSTRTCYEDTIVL